MQMTVYLKFVIRMHVEHLSVKSEIGSALNENCKVNTPTKSIGYRLRRNKLNRKSKVHVSEATKQHM